MVIAFGNLKGGAGKSVLSMYFSNYLAHKGFSVLLVDCDVSQHSSMSYEDQREGKDITLHRTFYNAEKYGDLFEYVNGTTPVYDFVILDLPGTVQQLGVLEVFALVDKLIIPTKLDMIDVDATKRYVEIIKESSETINRNTGMDLNLDYMVLPNNYAQNTDGYARVQEEKGFPDLKELFDDRAFPLGIRRYESLFKNDMAFGRYGGHTHTSKIEITLDHILSQLV
jgi:cellulose biosynthesis protein BcsQ